jgi:hypothetical protein
MRNYLQNSSSKSTDDVEKTKKKLETEEQEVQKVVAERNEIIQKLVEKSQLQEEEKQRVFSELKAKEEELSQFQHEVNKLNKRLLVERMTKRSDRDRTPEMKGGIADFTYAHVVRKLGADIMLKGSSTLIQRRFSDLINELPKSYIEDLESYGLFDNGLTSSGIRFLRDIATKHNA